MDQLGFAAGPGEGPGRRARWICCSSSGGNPVFTAPVDLGLRRPHRERRACASTWACTRTRPRAACQWHLPEAHYLEAWGDARAFDGTVTIHAAADRAALSRPRRRTRCSRMLTGQPGALRATTSCSGYWSRAAPRRGFRSLVAQGGARRRGARHGAAAPTRRRCKLRRIAARAPAPAPAALEIIFRPDPTIYDGRFANNGWLQELPKPITKLTWDNAAIMSPATAQRAGRARTATMVELSYQRPQADARPS